MLRRRQTAPGTYVSFAIRVTKVAFGAHREGVGRSLRYGATLVIHSRVFCEERKAPARV